MRRHRIRALATIAICATIAPSVALAATSACQEAPLLTSASSLDVLQTDYAYWPVVARDKTPECGPDQLTISVAGLPYLHLEVSEPAPGEIVGTLRVSGSEYEPGTYRLTYTITDRSQDTTSITLPLKIVPTGYPGVVPNTAPVLDPVSDLTMEVGKSYSFNVSVSDTTDRDLAASQQTLTIDGLPKNAVVEYTRLTKSRASCRVTITPSGADVGTYRVHIQGVDRRGGIVVAQMRITIR